MTDRDCAVQSREGGRPRAAADERVSWKAGQVDFTQREPDRLPVRGRYLTDARFHDVDLTNARFHLVDLTGAITVVQPW